MDIQATSLLSAALDVIADPASNLTAAVFLMAAAVLLVLIIVLLAIIVMLPGAGRRRVRDQEPARDGALEPEVLAESLTPCTAGPQPRRGSGAAWIVAAGIVVALASAYVGTAQSSYCVSCHAEVRPESSGGVHADVACVRCHEDTWALPSNALRRGLDIAAQYGLGSSAYTTDVPSRRCVACHRDIESNVTRNEETGVMMSHAEPLDAGYACADCHRSEAHADMAAPVGMSVCLACHDAETASAGCSTCHAKDPSAASGLAADRIYGKATITRTDCEGCHSMGSCDACHGIRMPHSEEFLRTHPRYSGFDLKEQCFEQCHTQGDCGKCHGLWSNHPPSFKEEHKRLPPESACNTCHSQHEGPICDLCHDFNQ